MKPRARARIRRRLTEGAVIVFSILLAFAIDAWWAERQLRLEEADALASLEAEFTANLGQVGQVIEVYSRSRQEVATLRKLSAEQIRALPQTRVSELMLATCNLWTFDPVLGTTDALVGAGKLGIIRSARLRAALTRFANLVADTREDVFYLQTNATDIWRAEVGLGGPWTDPATEVGYHGTIRGLDFTPKAAAEDLLRVRADTAFMGLISRFHINAGYYIVELERLRTQIQLILDLISESP